MNSLCLNSLHAGTLSVAYIVVFIITKASIWGIHMDFKHDSIPSKLKENLLWILRCYS